MSERPMPALRYIEIGMRIFLVTKLVLSFSCLRQEKDDNVSVHGDSNYSGDDFRALGILYDFISELLIKNVI